MRAASLTLAVFGFWLALSGHYTPFLIGIGVISTLLVVFADWKMGILDREGHPIQLLPGAVTYWPWLFWEILKSAWSVTKVILNPALPISPTMTVVRASQKTAAGIATYANSITLTPGTITTAVRGNDLIIHALVAGGADDLEGGGMDARVRRFEGEL